MLAPQWIVLIPVKQTAVAKSRLIGVDDSVRRDLALAFACDAVAAALGSARVGGVVVVTNDEFAGRRLADLGARVVPDVPDAGLNPALSHAAATVAADAPGFGLAVMSADLPATRSGDVSAVLDAAPHVRWFVADRAGDGTTMLGAPPGSDLAPAFGPGSGAAHRASGAVELSATELMRLRLDVDTLADLRAAVQLGVGAQTARVLNGTGVLEESA